MKKQVQKHLAALAAGSSLMAAGAANAAVDLTGITGAFTATDVSTGVLAVGGVLAVIYVTIKAAHTVLGMIRGR